MDSPDPRRPPVARPQFREMAIPGEIRLRFRFIHAADLHLASPLLGLMRISEDYAARIDG